MKKSLLILILLTAHCSLLTALDFGLLLNQYAGYGNAQKQESGFEYKGSLVPRLSFPVGANGEIFISASMTVGYEKNLYYYPELLQTEYSLRTKGWGFNVGRVSYQDPLGYIAQGLFDGFKASYTSRIGKFSLGGWYTGFIFKKSANIRMTDFDENLYNQDLAYNDFFNTYFGSRRVMAALEYDHPSVGERLSLKISVLGQFDLNNTPDKLNSQFYILKLGFPVYRFFFEAGGSFSTIQRKHQGQSFSEMAFAFDAGINFTVPSSFYSRLALTCNYTSGSMSNKLVPFSSINTVYIGNIFQAKRTALTAVSLDYSARVIEALGLSITASYFFRNDLVTGSYIVNGTEMNKALLGPEFYARIVWSPISDLQLNLGGGAFIPSLGNNWTNGKIQWKVELSALLAIF